jgi:YVTN family beta-propeller protein
MVLVLLLAAALVAQQPQQPAGQRPQQPATPRPAAAPAAATESPLNFEFYRTAVEPMFLVKREGNIRCVTCHAGSASSAFRLQPLADGALTYTEEQSRQNFQAVQKLVVPGVSPLASRLAKHPLAREAGGDAFHGGGKHWKSQTDPEFLILAAWIKGETRTPGVSQVRIIQTNSAGDNIHVIDPASNKVVGVISDIEVPHGVTSAPDGSKLYFTNESLSTVDVVDSRSLRIIKRIKLSGHPNNLTITKDGSKVYAGIAQNPGALDVIDTATLTNVKTIPVRGSVHNVYMSPDDKWVIAGSVASSYISIVDAKTNEMVRTIQETAGIRPMIFDTNPDGSTKNIYVQLSNFHGFARVDFATGKETARIEHAEVPGAEKHTDGLQAAPAHGLAITPDQHLWSTSKVNGYAYVYNLSDLKEVGRVFVGQHPEWVTLTPDGKFMYVAAAGDNAVTVVDTKAIKVVTHIPVGQVPKRNGTAMMQQ